MLQKLQQLPMRLSEVKIKKLLYKNSCKELFPLLHQKLHQMAH
jgi:hypothetical protein